MSHTNTINESINARVEQWLEKMTLAEKIGQMTQAEKNSITPQEVIDYAIGSVLSGGGGNPTPNNKQTWRDLVSSYQEAALKSRLGIPLIYGVDAVHGHNNVVGAVIFPHNIGLGATRDADLVKRIGTITAKELLGTSVHWNFAPAVSVPQDIRWGRTYEGFSEDTEIVRELGVAYTEGLQASANRVLASIKHYAADGGTTWGTSQRYEWIHGNWQAPDGNFSIDQGDAKMDEETLRQVHLQPYFDAVKAGALNVMTSFSSWNGEKMHGHKYLVTDVLKNEQGFEGFIVSDWMAVNQLDQDYYKAVVIAINAGVDMNMVPYDFRLFINTLTQAVENGDVTLERIDDAVRRILRAKVWLGLFDNPYGDEAFKETIGSDAHRQVGREAVQKSAVLLKNEDSLLPLSKSTSKILLAGRGADNIGMQCGGWTIAWQGGHGDITEGTSIASAFKAQLGKESVIYSETGDFSERAEIGVVVVGENPYAEGFGDNTAIRLSDEDSAVIEKTRANCERLVVILLSGRPLIVTDQLSQVDAFVAAFLPGTEGAGITDVLFGDAPFTGKLSFSWPRSLEQVPLSKLKSDPVGALFPIGFGLTT
jgi:beta-glucosidase